MHEHTTTGVRRARAGLPLTWLAGLLASVLVGSLGACASDDGGQGAPATFTEVYDEILFPRCAESICHGGAAGELDLTTRDGAYLALVGVQAAGPQCMSSGMVRVAPGDPDASLLYDKLSSTPSCGERMPIGTPLTDAELARIASWIAAGAPND